MFYYVYIIQSHIDKKFYTGYTKNLKLRFEEHNQGKAVATKDRRPFVLLYYEACRDRKDAMHREVYLKTAHGKGYIKNRIKSYLTG